MSGELLSNVGQKLSPSKWLHISFQDSQQLQSEIETRDMLSKVIYGIILNINIILFMGCGVDTLKCCRYLVHNDFM